MAALEVAIHLNAAPKCPTIPSREPAGWMAGSNPGHHSSLVAASLNVILALAAGIPFSERSRRLGLSS
jgi:hypothetical protein